MVDVVVHREGQRGVGPIDGAAGGVDQVRDPHVPAALQDVQEGDDVRVDVGVGVGQRVAHPRLRGQVDHAVEPSPAEQLGDGGALGEVQLAEAEARVPPQLRQPRLLEGDVVVVVEAVDPDEVVAARQQAPADMKADEAGRAGHQDPSHRRASSRADLPSPIRRSAAGPSVMAIGHLIASPIAWPGHSGIDARAHSMDRGLTGAGELASRANDSSSVATRQPKRGRTSNSCAQRFHCRSIAGRQSPCSRFPSHDRTARKGGVPAAAAGLHHWLGLGTHAGAMGEHPRRGDEPRRGGSLHLAPAVRKLPRHT
jgi:hypothetical protein